MRIHEGEGEAGLRCNVTHSASPASAGASPGALLRRTSSRTSSPAVTGAAVTEAAVTGAAVTEAAVTEAAVLRVAPPSLAPATSSVAARAAFTSAAESCPRRAACSPSAERAASSQSSPSIRSSRSPARSPTASAAESGLTARTLTPTTCGSPSMAFHGRSVRPKSATSIFGSLMGTNALEGIVRSSGIGPCVAEEAPSARLLGGGRGERESACDGAAPAAAAAARLSGPVYDEYGSLSVLISVVASAPKAESERTVSGSPNASTICSASASRSLLLGERASVLGL